MNDVTFGYLFKSIRITSGNPNYVAVRVYKLIDFCISYRYEENNIYNYCIINGKYDSIKFNVKDSDEYKFVVDGFFDSIKKDDFNSVRKEKLNNKPKYYYKSQTHNEEILVAITEEKAIEAIESIDKTDKEVKILKFPKK